MASQVVPPFQRAPRPVVRAWWPRAGGALAVVSLALVSRADLDLWGHLRFGLDTLDQWQLSKTDRYSFTQDRPWTNHEWLSEVLMAVAWRFGGTPGLVALKGLLVASTFWLVWIALGKTRLIVRLAVMLFVARATVHMTLTIRPQLWTFVGVAVLCHALMSPGTRRRWMLPVLFAVWVNVHGGWILGWGILAAWACAEVAVRPGLLRDWVLLLAACTAATLLNPYGLEMWSFVLRTVRFERSITEWQPVWAMGSAVWLAWTGTLAAAVWILIRAPSRHWPTLIVIGLLAYASWRVMRINSLFVEATAILLAPVMAQRWPVSPGRSRRQSSLEPVAAAGLFLGGVVVAVMVGAKATACVTIPGRLFPDPVARQWLASAVPGRLVTYFDWGQYAIWHLGPHLRVSMDGRRETIYTDARLAEHDAIIRGEADGLAALQAWRAEYVWLPITSAPTRSWLVVNGYRIDLETDRSFVAVREDLPPLAPDDHGLGVRSCFPG